MTERDDPAGLPDVSDFRDSGRAALLTRGRTLCAAGRCEEALEVFDRALTLCPDDPDVLFWAGQEHLHICEYGRAEELLRKAWALAPDRAGPARLLVRLLDEHLGLPEEAGRLLDEALERHPDNGGLLKAQAEQELSAGRPRQAADLYERVLRATPDDPEARDGAAAAYNECAFALQRQGDTEQGIFLLRRALALSPDWSGLHVNLGLLFSSLGRMEQARRELETAALEDPSDPIAAFNLGRHYRDCGEPAQAIEWYRQALALDDGYPDARPELAGLLFEEGRFDWAAALLEDELLRDPLCPVCTHNLGLAYEALGRSAEALVRLRRAVRLDPSYFQAHYNLAALEAAQGDLEAALRLLRAACLIDSERARSWLRHGPPELSALSEHPEIGPLLRAQDEESE